MSHLETILIHPEVGGVGSGAGVPPLWATPESHIQAFPGAPLDCLQSVCGQAYL